MVKATSVWAKQPDLVRTYLTRMGHIYGKGIYRQEAEGTFHQALRNPEVTTHVRDPLWAMLALFYFYHPFPVTNRVNS